MYRPRYNLDLFARFFEYTYVRLVQPHVKKIIGNVTRAPSTSYKTHNKYRKHAEGKYFKILITYAVRLMDEQERKNAESDEISARSQYTFKISPGRSRATVDVDSSWTSSSSSRQKRNKDLWPRCIGSQVTFTSSANIEILFLELFFFSFYCSGIYLRDRGFLSAVCNCLNRRLRDHELRWY